MPWTRKNTKRDDDIFIHSGPSHITALDWTDPYHRRSVMASLITGVRVLERDRQLRNEGSGALAPAWWEHFHFKLHEQLRENSNSIIFGAVFEFMSSTINEAPKFVIALRGTMIETATALPDLEQDFGILINNLHQSSRFGRVLSCAENMVASVGVRKVWLAGYSLGAGITLLTGKEMAKKGLPMETYLFNPPFVSLSLEWMKSSKIKLSAYITRTVARAAAAVVKSKLGDLRAGRNESVDPKYDPFAAIKDWEPHLFVSSYDLICSGYIGYFKARKVMSKMNMLRDLEKRATQDTIIRGLLTGEWDREQEPMHLLASAKVTINKNRSSESAHRIQQWWNPQLKFKYKLYQY